MAALSVIAQDFDSQGAGVEFSQALRRGMTALKESEDFVLGDSESQIGMDVAGLVESHHSGALSKSEAEGMTPIQALQRYYGYAQIQIQKAVGKNVVSAEALFCLGRLYTLAEAGEMMDGKLDRAKAMVYHRASLACDPTNHRSANELGVLLAEFGELQDALKLIRHSLQIRQTPSTWENLAKLHDRLNQPHLADAARIEHQRMLANQNSGMIHWVDSGQFNAGLPTEARMAANSQFLETPNKTRSEKTTGQPTEPEKDNRSISDRLKSWF
jgi:tetratricopeptide (TPR) repeat protein